MKWFVGAPIVLLIYVFLERTREAWREFWRFFEYVQSHGEDDLDQPL